MFAELTALVFGKAAAAETAGQAVDESRLAQAALLFHVIAADGIVSDDENARLNTILTQRFGLSAEDTTMLTQEAQRADNEAVDLFAFTRVLKRELAPEAKLSIVRDLWEMVYADGVVHEFEDNIVWRVAELLDVGARDRIELKQMVRQAAGAPES